MALRLPSEVVVEEVLPTLRVELAHELAAYDLTQEEIASHLGVTQAAVSQYLRGDAGGVDRIADHPLTAETVERVAAGLADGGMDEYDALAAVLDLIRAFEDRGPICELHEAAMPALQGLGCDLCVRGTDRTVREERATLRSVRTAARTLATAPGVAAYVPSVGTNAATALPDAEATADVAAIPGRIYAAGDRVEVPANPEFGASHHVASVVLTASAVDSDVRGAVNLATGDDLLAAAEARGLEPMAFDAGYEDRDDRLRAQFEARGGVPRVVFHRGAFGIEPITYVLGADAAAAADLAVDLIEAADARR
jgi:hypothetical protein